ncbi:MAG: hypothetical protein K8R53_00390, partial [Bacteroidales bacterium]|nr:hypothetical protein [Bacteroidales bacterium]
MKKIIFTGLLILTFAGAVTAQLTLQGLVAYYPFNNGSANDESGNGNHGTVFGATPTADRFGNPISALDFDGVDDYVSVPISTSTIFTIAAWLNPDTDNPEISQIFNKEGEFSFQYRSLSVTGNKLAQYTYQGDLLFSNTDLSVNDWNFVTIIHTPDTAMFYLNAMSDGGGATSPRSLSGEHYIGGRAGGAASLHLDGIIDDVRIYNRALTEAEILLLYECGQPFIDPRDGQTYNTILIGSQCWMAENLNIGTMINGSQNMNDDGIIEKYCYGNNTSRCDEYGGLYQW